jgi:hypothetical protein
MLTREEQQGPVEERQTKKRTPTVRLQFIGIHNAWDNVIYITIELSRPENKSQDQ